MSGLSDSFQRPIDYLRLSVTDRCNLRCCYCMPAQGVPLLSRDNILTYEEILIVVRVAAELGVTRVRISGGEPLVREGLTYLLQQISSIKGIDDLSLTTNGILLRHHAAELKRAGLQRVNVSLDTLKQSRFQQITGSDKLGEVLEGIVAARLVGLEPVKINMVVMRGVNDDELGDFALLSWEDGWHVRFVELMPLVDGESRNLEWGGDSRVSVGDKTFMSAQEIKQVLAPLGDLQPCLSPRGNGPAKYYRLPGARGTLGFITPVSDHFCFGCNRLRLTAEGKLHLCLLSDEEIDLRESLRQGTSVEEIKLIIQRAAQLKPRGHRLSQGIIPGRPMSQIGG